MVSTSFCNEWSYTSAYFSNKSNDITTMFKVSNNSWPLGIYENLFFKKTKKPIIVSELQSASNRKVM